MTRALDTARKRFDALRGAGSQSGESGTDALMNQLRGYDQDSLDPALAPPKRARPARPARRRSAWPQP